MAVARLLAEGGFAAEAVSRSYFAVFYAAEACLLALGEERSKHSAVLSAFTERLVRSAEIQPEIGRILRRLFDQRNRADYAATEPEADEARTAIADAERFIAAAEAWLEARRTA